MFQDYNSNGLYDTTAGFNSIDAGVAGVTVSAFDSSGTARGTAVTNASGAFSFAATGTGPYRLEFSTIPAGYYPSARSTDSLLGGTTSNSGSTVQFVADGNTSNINLGLSRAEEYCENNPDIVVSRFAEGDQNGSFAANPVLANFPYISGALYSDTTVANYDNPTTHSITTPASKIGVTYSLTYNKATGRVYAASFFKRHGGFGPGADATFNNADDPGAIYLVNPATSLVANTFTVPNVTINSHDTNDYGTDNTDTGWNAVGKTSLGGMDIADDGSRLFVMNLEDRKLYALNPTTGASLGSSVSVTTLTLPTPGGTATNCSNGSGAQTSGPSP